MPKINVPLRDDNRAYKGEVAEGVAWSPSLRIDLAGWTSGALTAAGRIETYADSSAWADGASGPVGSGEVSIPDWKLRNFFRTHKAAAIEILPGLEALLLESVAGDPVPIGSPAWLDEALETAPAPEPDPAPEG